MTELSDGVAMEESRCPKCGYALVGLPEFRFPECGTPFDPGYVQDVAARTHLLPWERPESGRKLKRLSRTILHASLHPGRFFSTLSQRKDRPIENAGSFVVACVIALICLHITAFLLDKLVFFLRLTWRHGDPLRALNTIGRTARTTASSGWFTPTLQVLTMLLSIFLITVFLAHVFRHRLGALRDMDFAVMLSPAITCGAFIAAFTVVVLAISQYSLMELIAVAVCGQAVVLLLVLVWHFCRKLLGLSWAKAVAIVMVCVLLQFGLRYLANAIQTLLRFWSLL
ncbi:MAG: hypothetical protein JSU63_21195 [Phycisphaerales bacterium]|nr:MAG: hypothetical protein JSU63_21195 [Phycisphaerales bacterium]